LVENISTKVRSRNETTNLKEPSKETSSNNDYQSHTGRTNLDGWAENPNE